MKKSTLNKAFLSALVLGGIFIAAISCKRSSTSEGDLSASKETKANVKFGSLQNFAVSEINTSTQAETGFENGTTGSYFACTYRSPSFAQVMTPTLGAMAGTKAMKFQWQQSTWDAGDQDCSNHNSRDRKGVEACSNLVFAKDGWFGAGIMIPSGYPTNRHTIVSQGFNNAGCGSWGWIFYLEGTDLRLSYRSSCSESGSTVHDTLIVSNIQFSVWHPYIVQWSVSHTNHGKIVIWWDTATQTKNTPTFQVSNINLGFGNTADWTTDDKFVSGKQWKMKYGIYASDCCVHVGDNGTRILYYDNVGEWVDDSATNLGFDKVNPNQ